MEEKRLTYRQICNLVAQKKHVPKGYNIKFAGIVPKKVIDETIDAVNNVKFQRNSFPMPDEVKICGEHIVVVPQLRYDEMENTEDALVDFGNVYVETMFHLTTLNFKYKSERQTEIEREINKITESFNSYVIRKGELTFDMSLKLSNETLFIMNAMPVSADLNSNDNITVELNYDYFSISE